MKRVNQHPCRQTGLSSVDFWAARRRTKSRRLREGQRRWFVNASFQGRMRFCDSEWFAPADANDALAVAAARGDRDNIPAVAPSTLRNGPAFQRGIARACAKGASRKGRKAASGSSARNGPMRLTAAQRGQLFGYCAAQGPRREALATFTTAL